MPNEGTFTVEEVVEPGTLDIDAQTDMLEELFAKKVAKIL